jgi:hypothetical protein
VHNKTIRRAVVLNTCMRISCDGDAYRSTSAAERDRPMSNRRHGGEVRLIHGNG